MLKTSRKRKNSNKVKRKGKPYQIVEAWQSVNNPNAPVLVIVKPAEER